MEVKLAPQNCEELVLNPSFDEGTSYWSFIDRGYSKVGLHAPGSSGLFDFALRSYSRNMKDNNTWRGGKCPTVSIRFLIKMGCEWILDLTFFPHSSSTIRQTMLC